MNERAPLPDALARPERGRALVLAPHPDDDVLGCGGTAALHVGQGDPVHVVIVYDGVLGDPQQRFDPAEIARVRQGEARAGGACLGLSDYEFWGYPEGHEPGAPEFAVGARRVAELVRVWRPDVVYAPWIGEHHVDHHVLARVARAGLELADFGGAAWGFEVWTPLVATRVVDITTVAEQKLAALRKHASQAPYGDVAHCGMGLNAQRSVYLPGEATFGEAFAPLGPATDLDREWVGIGR